MSNDAINVEVKDNDVLVISGQREEKQEKGGEGGTWHRVERSFGSFERRFQLPRDADVENVSANCKNGELRVTVPKRADRKGGSRKIGIQ